MQGASDSPQLTYIADEFFERDTDYLGIIGEQLGNLTGYATLANELLQNADDAGARAVSFDIRRDALVVENNEQFSDCERPHERQCPWLSTRAYPCDFHSFRLV